MLLMLVTMGMSGFAQVLSDYIMTTGTDATKWQTLTTTTNLITGAGDSKASAVTDIGFTFNFAGTNYTQFSVNSDGNLRFGAAVTGTTTVGIDSWLAGSVTLFPNPAREVVNVQCTMNNVQLTGELSVFDVYGKLLQIVPITSEITPINVSNLANGMYFVRVTTEAGAVTKTFVKKG